MSAWEGLRALGTAAKDVRLNPDIARALKAMSSSVADMKTKEAPHSEE